MSTFTNPVRDKFARNEPAFCMALRLARTPEIAMIAQASGFDAFYIDMEHCTISLDAAAAICTAALPLGIAPMARIAGHRFEDATRLLDMGALGIIAPQVDTPEQAQAFAAACRFPPVGTRSVAGAGPLQGYRPTPLRDINAQGNAATVLVAMLETPEGVENAEAIASVPGIDVLLIGSNDFCTAMGIPGEVRQPRLRAAYEAALAACRRHGKQLGIGGIRSDPGHVAELVALGARFVIAGSDVQYLLSAARSDLAALRKSLPE